MRRRNLAVMLVVLLAATTWVSAEIKLPSILGDNMVLQADKPLPIWGWATAGKTVSVTACGQTVTGEAGKDGTWKVMLPAMKAGGPIEVTVAEQGAGAVTIKNVLIGEVWVCSGQSNMAFTVSRGNHAKEEIAAAEYPKIRLFTVARKTAAEPQSDCEGKWVECSPQTAGGFSAVGYFFGRDLHRTLGVPVGLINTSWGGTPSESWTRRGVLEKLEVFQQQLASWDKRIETFDPVKAKAAAEKATAAWQAKIKPILTKHRAAVAAAKKAGKPAPPRPRLPRRPRVGQNPATNSHRPANLYNGMIAPLIPLAIRGAIWYQGESNAGRAFQYRTIFPAMITNWRQDWGQGEFPFLWVQLANYRARKDQPADSDWAELREAQHMALALPHTGEAVIIDIGEAKDIHPKNKQDVGKRLALGAMRIAYDRDLVYSGPTVKKMAVEGSKVRLTFENVGHDLVARGGELKGFAVAGADKKFVWARARIDGNDVIVSSDQVAKPVAVRYGWADNPECTLYNKEGLPASPFRTDTWPGVTDKAR